MEEAEAAKLLRMEDDLKEHVIGQDEAVTAISKALRRSRADLKDPRRPIGSFIFLGPTGVGKTFLARNLAEFMFGDPDALIQIDMSEYMEKFTSSVSLVHHLGMLVMKKEVNFPKQFEEDLIRLCFLMKLKKRTLM